MNKMFALTGALALNMAGSALAEEVFIPEGYSDFGSPGAITVSRPVHAVLDTLIGFPESHGSGSERLEMKSYFDRADRLVLDVTESGLADDSVSATNRKFVFKQAERGSYQLWGYGFRRQCARSEDIEEWVATACP